MFLVCCRNFSQIYLIAEATLLEEEQRRFSL